MNDLTNKLQQFDDVFRRIGSDWMLISASDGERVNTMTASWGCCGVLWNKRIAVCFIRPQRYTFPIVESATHFSLAFFDGEEREALRYCGRQSGRDGDKFAGAGLTCAATADGVPYPKEAKKVLICKKIYVDSIKPEGFLDPALLANYPIQDYHGVFVGEIVDIIEA